VKEQIHASAMHGSASLRWVLEVVLQSELQVAWADSAAKAGDLSEVGSSERKTAGIGEHRGVGYVGRFKPELDAVTFHRGDALQQRGIEGLDARAAIVEVARSAAGNIDCRLGEGCRVEVSAEPILHAPGGARIADQVGTLRAVPDVAA
jgi:hypothetical protein